MSTELEEKATAVTVVEQSSPLITIEPAKYVALVFEPFAKRLAAAKEIAKTITFDIATTSGMRAAVEQRATFRDIRVGSEKARKERKAPILEIGKLLDGRQKEIEAEIEPYESKYDDAIKAEEKRKDEEKIAKALAESQRITAIRVKIDEFRKAPQQWLTKSSVDISVAADHLSERVISLDEYMEYVGEATVERDAAVKQLRTMQEAMRLHETEQQRLADERAELARLRVEQEERDRVAAAARAEYDRRVAAERAEQEAKDRAERERVATEQAEAAARAAEAMRVQQEEHEAHMASGRAELAFRQAEIDRVQAEQERVAREAREAAEAEERAEAKRIAEAEMVEATRIQAQKDATEAERVRVAEAAETERLRREKVQFELNGPDAVEIVALLAIHYEVEQETALNWLSRHAWSVVEIEA